MPFSLYAIGPRSPTTAAWSSPNACGRPAAAPRQRLAAASVSSRFQFNLPFQLPGFPGGKDPKKQAAHEQLIAVCWAQVRNTPHMFPHNCISDSALEGRFASGLLDLVYYPLCQAALPAAWTSIFSLIPSLLPVCVLSVNAGLVQPSESAAADSAKRGIPFSRPHSSHHASHHRPDARCVDISGVGIASYGKVGVAGAHVAAGGFKAAYGPTATTLCALESRVMRM